MPTPSATTLQAETAREADDRLGDGGVLRIGLEVGDERDVDLQRVDREMLQVGQRRVAGAEIVDRDGEALVAQLMQHLADRVEVVQEARLRDLELDPRRVALLALDDVRDALREILAIELPRRQVDRQRRVPCPALRHATHWAAAVFSTHSPSAWMRPDSSASGMNTCGGTLPCSGSVQRSSASAPMIARSWMRTTGW